MRSHDGRPPLPPAALDEKPARLGAEPEAGSDRDPSARWAVALLAQAAPYQARPGRKERIWLRLQAGRVRRPARLGLAFAAAMLIAGGAFASAALAGWPAWLARALGHVAPAPSLDVRRVPAPIPRSRRMLGGLPAATPALSLPEPAPSPAATAPSGALAPAPRVRRAPKPATLLVPPEATSQVASEIASEDTEPLLAAMRALRVEHDPGRARSLLSPYLAQHPRGELAEEALVMLVEAAVAHHDRDASALAARYFRLYPHGPFRGQVERTLAAYGKRP